MMSKNDKYKENNKITGTVPELDVTEPPKVIMNNLPTMSIKITCKKLQTPSDASVDTDEDSDDCQIILPKIEIIDITDDITDNDESKEENKVEKDDTVETEAISEDEIRIEEPKPVTTEFDKFWQAVKDDPSDFAGWTYLLQYVDQENNIENAREAYNKFLQLFPNCYGYWKKFADFEKRNNNKEECEAVFMQGLKAIPLSVNLWIHYMTYLKTHHADDVQQIRSKFDKGLEACGLEYRSDQLWDHYIKWEIDQNKLLNAFNIYSRLLTSQTLGHVQHFEHFKEFVYKNLPDKILSAKEYLELRQKEADRLRLSGSDELLTDDSTPHGKEKNTSLSHVSVKELSLLKETIIEMKFKIHRKTGKEISKRQSFEEGIKRPYFHVKPLEKCQIDNWKDYIAFEKSEGDHQRIVFLYERCLIACALYEDFWLSYLDYLESLYFDTSNLLNDLFTRACVVHHPRSLELNFKWSAFEESRGNADKAAEILMNLDEAVPHVLQIIYRRINLEKRRDHFDKVSEFYEHYINTSHTKCLASNIAIKYARFLWKCMNRIDKAIEVITDIVCKDKDNMQDNARLLLQLIELKMNVKPLNETLVIQIFDEILSMSSVSLEQKILFSQRKLEFIENYTSDYKSLRKASKELKFFSELLAEEKEIKTKQAQEMVAATSSSSQIAWTNYQDYNSSGYYPQQYPPPTGQDHSSYQYQNWGYQQPNYNQGLGSYNYSSCGGSGEY